MKGSDYRPQRPRLRKRWKGRTSPHLDIRPEVSVAMWQSHIHMVSWKGIGPVRKNSVLWTPKPSSTAVLVFRVDPHLILMTWNPLLGILSWPCWKSAGDGSKFCTLGEHRIAVKWMFMFHKKIVFEGIIWSMAIYIHIWSERQLVPIFLAYE